MGGVNTHTHTHRHIDISACVCVCTSFATSKKCFNFLKLKCTRNITGLQINDHIFRSIYEPVSKSGWHQLYSKYMRSFNIIIIIIIIIRSC